MAKHRTIGTNPLDAVVPRLVPEAGETGGAAAEPRTGPEARVGKQRLTVHLPVDLIERVKNTVYWTPGLTLARLAESSLARIVDELEGERERPSRPGWKS